MRSCMSKPKAAPLLPRWDDVRYLLAVLRAGSFTEAARLLATDQSTVSRRIVALQAALGVALFERTGRAPLPTESAEQLREAAERIEAEVGRFQDDVLGIQRQAVSGRVRLALTEELAIHLLVPRVLPRLRAAYPDLSIDLVTSYRAADLVGREADIAVRFFQTQRGDLLSRRVGQLATAVLAARAQAHRLRRRPLRDIEWISVELAGAPSPESTWLAAHSARAPVLVCNSYQVQSAAIRAGLGVGVGPRILTRLDEAFVALERPEWTLPPLELHLVTRRAIRTLPRIAVVMDELARFLGELS